jgi:hypothetical protein
MQITQGVFGRKEYCDCSFPFETHLGELLRKLVTAKPVEGFDGINQLL